MSEPKHSNVLLGKSIREIRLRRGLTQREVSEAIGGISESALRSYELGERRPKQNTLERIAETLDVAPACFDTYGIERYDELVHALFLLEDRFGIEPCADGSIRFTDEGENHKRGIRRQERWFHEIGDEQDGKKKKNDCLH